MEIEFLNQQSDAKISKSCNNLTTVESFHYSFCRDASSAIASIYFVYLSAARVVMNQDQYVIDEIF